MAKELPEKLAKRYDEIVSVEHPDPIGLVRTGKSEKKSYNLNYFYGLATIRRVAGEYIEDPLEIRRIGHALLMLAATLESERTRNPSYTQSEYRLLMTKVIAVAMGQMFRWDFTPNQEEYVWHRGSKTQPLPYRYGACVYFIRHADFPGCVKVGSTENIWRRTQQLYKEYALDPAQPIVLSALAKTDGQNHKELEYWLKELFVPDKVTGEWFASPSVEWYISFMRQHFANPR